MSNTKNKILQTLCDVVGNKNVAEEILGCLDFLTSTEKGYQWLQNYNYFKLQELKEESSRRAENYLTSLISSIPNSGNLVSRTVSTRALAMILGDDNDDKFFENNYPLDVVNRFDEKFGEVASPALRSKLKMLRKYWEDEKEKGAI